MNSGTVVTHEPQAQEEEENCEEKGAEAERGHTDWMDQKGSAAV